MFGSKDRCLGYGKSKHVEEANKKFQAIGEAYSGFWKNWARINGWLPPDGLFACSKLLVRVQGICDIQVFENKGKKGLDTSIYFWLVQEVTYATYAAD
ncbi:hypothetical protein Tco_0731454 [Tanacetum coccineum]